MYKLCYAYFYLLGHKSTQCKSINMREKIYINKICISNKVCAGDNNEIDNIGKYNKFIGEQRKE